MPAHMIPPEPKEFDEGSDEGFVFEVLRNLSDEYYVFHSVSIKSTNGLGVVKEREIDFVIVNKNKGILCLEAKNGRNITYKNRTWYYGSGKAMEHNGPYNQVSGAKHELLKYIRFSGVPCLKHLEDNIKVLSGVFFFRMPKFKFDQIIANGVPEDCDPRLTLLADDVTDIGAGVRRMFEVKPKDGYERREMTDDEFKALMDYVICPAFNLIPSPADENSAELFQQKQLLREQCRILDFLEEQRSAVINGAAGTGKTMVAIEKARRHSINDEKVLFLCYNHLLCSSLNEQYKNSKDKAYRTMFKNVTFMTISELTKQVTGNAKDFEGLEMWLMDCTDHPEKFEYQHIIVDEGQDFGLVDAEMGASAEEAASNVSIIDELDAVAAASQGTFYLFYDKYQKIQGGVNVDYKIPACIDDCDCRLTLSKNCRNTREIASTSYTPLRDKNNNPVQPNAACSWFTPHKPVMHLIQNKADTIEVLEDILQQYADDQIDNVWILSTSRIDYSNIYKRLRDDPKEKGYCWQYKSTRTGKIYPVTTCIRYKGLEADGVIIIDLNKESFDGRMGMQFYVGSSRAKLRLDFVMTLLPADYETLIKKIDPNTPDVDDEDVQRMILGNTFSADVETYPEG